MKHIILDCTQMTTRQSAHDYLAKMLGLPKHYGRNLDALYDCLTERGEPICLELIHTGALKDLGQYEQALWKALSDAAAVNPALTLAFPDAKFS